MAGSSPLTRGKRGGRLDLFPCRGLIPAHAGKTKAVEDPHSRMWAHPRSRGENYGGDPADLKLRGSSPLTRGKHRNSPSRRGSPGLIPAHAGKTLPARPGPHPVRAHPRSRGENVGQAQVLDLIGGSSPLTRGKPENGFSLGTAWRLIPAHAGKTTVIHKLAGPSWAHPRSRGENIPATVAAIR